MILQSNFSKLKLVQSLVKTFSLYEKDNRLHVTQEREYAMTLFKAEALANHLLTFMRFRGCNKIPTSNSAEILIALKIRSPTQA